MYQIINILGETNLIGATLLSVLQLYLIVLSLKDSSWYSTESMYEVSSLVHQNI